MREQWKGAVGRIRVVIVCKRAAMGRVFYGGHVRRIAPRLVRPERARTKGVGLSPWRACDKL